MREARTIWLSVLAIQFFFTRISSFETHFTCLPDIEHRENVCSKETHSCELKLTSLVKLCEGVQWKYSFYADCEGGSWTRSNMTKIRDRGTSTLVLPFSVRLFQHGRQIIYPFINPFVLHVFWVIDRFNSEILAAKIHLEPYKQVVTILVFHDLRNLPERKAVGRFLL